MGRSMQDDLFDLAVIGGGPAGSSAAITAARAGARVLLLERGRLPRQRVCGEFISAESLVLLAGLLESTAPALLREAVRVPRGRLFFDGHTVPAEIDPPAASIARFDLDFALWRAALETGVSAHLETNVEKISGHGPFILHSNGQSFSARAVVNASGRWSNLHALPADDHSHAEDRWLAVKGHFSEPSPPASVDLYFFEGGYCGVQPVALATSRESRVNACAMVRSEIARSLSEVFEQHPVLQARSRHWKPLSDPVTTSPLLFRNPEPVDNGVFLVGDSAAFVDPFVGDGISLALRGGALAAECLLPFLRSTTSLADATLRYQKEYRNRLAPVFRTSSRLRHLLALPRPIRRSVAVVLEKIPAMSRLLVRITR